MQKISDSPMKTCPECGQDALTKLISAAGFQLKGSGWYATDFKGGSKKPAEKKADTKSDSKSDSKGDSKTESKPETKTESKAAA